MSFRLTNHTRGEAAFRAYFTPDSDLDFYLTPSQGVLLSYGDEGTLLTITFMPT